MSISSFVKSHAVLATTVVIVAVAGTIIAGRVANRSKPADTTESNVKKVSLVDASSFKGGGSKVAADGTVESVSQVDLKSQVSAPLGIVNVSVGDSVYAGQTILTLSNADIRAQLDQARAALQLAQGQYSSGGVSLDSARKNAIDKIRDAYLKSDDTIHGQLDAILLNNVGGTPQLYSFLIDTNLANTIRTTHNELGTALRSWKTVVDTLTASSPDDAILSASTLSAKNLDALSRHLDNISSALSQATRVTTGSDLVLVSGWQATVAAARSSINAANTNVTTAQSAFSNARVSLGSSANAQVSAAEAGVKNLEAQLAKTVLTSPISGKIAALPLRTGELASPGMLLATVIGGGGLEVKAYASGEDLSRIKVGAKALIQGAVPGTVSSVAPSVSQINKKVEVKISVTGSSVSSLVVGQNVPVSITAASDSSAAASGTYLLPIQNVKIIPGDAFVFTVDGDSKVVQHQVMLGAIQGDFVEVKGGLTDDMKIISPVYQLVEGETVTIQ